MVKKTTSRSAPASKAVTAERAARLYRLLQFLGRGPQTRAALARRLRLDVRGFYRDLNLLRAAGIDLLLQDGRYALQKTLEDAVGLLPFPDPLFTLGEARQLATGRTRAHRKLKQQIAQIVD